MPTLSQIDRVYARIPVAATNADGTAATLTGVSVALLPRGGAPDGHTAWAAASYAAGVATILLAAPAADRTGAVPIPPSGADLWIRGVDGGTEVVAVFVDSIQLR